MSIFCLLSLHRGQRFHQRQQNFTYPPPPISCQHSWQKLLHGVDVTRLLWMVTCHSLVVRELHRSAQGACPVVSHSCKAAEAGMWQTYTFIDRTHDATIRNWPMDNFQTANFIILHRSLDFLCERLIHFNAIMRCSTRLKNTMAKLCRSLS